MLLWDISGILLPRYPYEACRFSFFSLSCGICLQCRNWRRKSLSILVFRNWGTRKSEIAREILPTSGASLLCFRLAWNCSFVLQWLILQFIAWESQSVLNTLFTPETFNWESDFSKNGYWKYTQQCLIKYSCRTNIARCFMPQLRYLNFDSEITGVSTRQRLRRIIYLYYNKNIRFNIYVLLC